MQSSGCIKCTHEGEPTTTAQYTMRISASTARSIHKKRSGVLQTTYLLEVLRCRCMRQGNERDKPSFEYWSQRLTSHAILMESFTSLFQVATSDDRAVLLNIAKVVMSDGKANGITIRPERGSKSNARVSRNDSYQDAKLNARAFKNLRKVYGYHSARGMVRWVHRPPHTLLSE
jgi:S-adenosylmethionine:diacylglycerol 3-amino-3-carboxypropyl transferase